MMSESRTIGTLIVAFGIVAILAGVVVMRGGIGWFGHLPGDIRVERPGFRLYVPIATMLLVSVVLSLVSWVVRRFF